jgi:ABC-type multidrug transport system ATPase subunit
VDNVIETHNLTKRFRRLVAVDSISLTVGRGQVFGFLGPNGSGKTTTIGMLLDIITPTAGQIQLLGERGRAGLHKARQRVGATLEAPNFYPHLSGYDNLRVTTEIKRLPRSRIDQALETVGLTDRRNDRFQTYSLGMKQRLAVAAAMLGDPELLFFDEPMNGLDPEGMHEMRDVIADIARQGRTVFLSSHLLHEVERSCTNVAVIKKGRLLAHGSLVEILARHMVAALRSEDLAALERTLREYPAAKTVQRDGETVIAELADNDLARANGFLASKGVFLSYLAPRQKTLEDVFMELTQDDDTGAAA